MRTAIIAADGMLELVGQLQGHDLRGKTTRADVPDDWPALHCWDVATQSWLENVSGERSRLIALMQAKRDALQAGGCPTPPGLVTPAGVVQTDPTSLNNIDRYSNLALAAKVTSKPFSLSLTLADNRQVTVDADGMLAIGEATAAMFAAAHALFVTIRTQLNAATTLAQLRTLVPPT